jgi:kynurenine formamidase
MSHDRPTPIVNAFRAQSANPRDNRAPPCNVGTPGNVATPVLAALVVRLAPLARLNRLARVLVMMASATLSLGACDRDQPRDAGYAVTSIDPASAEHGVGAASSPPMARPSSYKVDFSRGRWIDLTHSLEEDMPHLPADGSSFRLVAVQRGKAEGAVYVAANRLEMAEQIGTHVDAPNHLKEGGLPLDQIPLESLAGIAVIVDVSDVCRDPLHLISIADIESWERKSGENIDASIVIFKTGYSRYWGDNEKYFGTKRQDAAGAPLARYPALSVETAVWLATARNVKSVGIDGPGIDPPLQVGAHTVLAEQAVPVIENIGSLDKLGTATHVFLSALPIKVKNGAGGAVRIAAFLSYP